MIILFLSMPVFSANPINYITGDLLESGKKTTITSENKKGVVVIFLSAKCPCSNSHLSELKALYKDYKNFNFVGIHSNSDESPETAKTYFTKAQLPFPIIEDKMTTLADQFKASKTPHAFVVSTRGEILYQGGVSNSSDFSKSDRHFLREALENVEAGQVVKTPEGRTLGCSIARGGKHVF